MLIGEQAMYRADERARAVHALVEAHYAAILRFLSGMLGDEHTAADLAQECFLRAYNALHRLPDDANVKAWLFTIAANLARQQFRRRRLLHWVSLDRPGVVLAQATETEDGIIRRAAVHAALAALPPDYRTCLLLDLCAGMSGGEIARATGRTEAAVRQLLVRARRRFRELYAQGSGEEYIHE